MVLPEPTVRLARRDDAHRCNAFHNTHYGRSRSLAQCEWEFYREVLPDGTIPFAIAEFEGEIVGTQALLPIELVDREGSYWSAKSEETLVAASMRGRGLFKRMYKLLYDYARDHSIRNIWGFTPAASAFIKEGFESPATTSQLVRVLRPDAIRSLRQREGSRPGASIQLLERVTSRALAALGVVASVRTVRRHLGLALEVLDSAPAWADALSLRFASEWNCTTLHRSQAYLQWRFFDNPSHRPIFIAARVEDEPVGFVVAGVDAQGVGAIIDIIAVDAAGGALPAERLVSVLVAEATQWLREAGASVIRTWEVTRHPFAMLVGRRMKWAGWVHVPKGFAVVLMNTPGLPPRPGASSIDGWYITRAFTEGHQP